MLHFSVKELTSTRFQMDVSQDGMYVGTAKFIHEDDSCILTWIEVEDSYQSIGIGTKIMNHIVDQWLGEAKDLRINVVDEQTIDFYSKWLSKTMAISERKINDFIQYPDDSTHPVMVIPKDFLENQQGNRYKP